MRHHAVAVQGFGENAHVRLLQVQPGALRQRQQQHPRLPLVPPSLHLQVVRLRLVPVHHAVLHLLLGGKILQQVFDGVEHAHVKRKHNKGVRGRRHRTRVVFQVGAEVLQHRRDFDPPGRAPLLHFQRFQGVRGGFPLPAAERGVLQPGLQVVFVRDQLAHFALGAVQVDGHLDFFGQLQVVGSQAALHVGLLQPKQLLGCGHTRVVPAVKHWQCRALAVAVGELHVRHAADRPHHAK